MNVDFLRRPVIQRFPRRHFIALRLALSTADLRATLPSSPNKINVKKKMN